MSILDTFFILFQSSAKEVKKDTQEAGKAVDALEKHISDSDKATSQLGDSFKKMITAGVSALGAFATFNSLKNGVLQAATANADLERQSRLTGESAASLAAWDAAVVQAGGRAGEFTGWLADMNRQFVNMGMGNRTGAILQNLRSLSEAWRNAGLSMADMLAQGQKAGISENIVLLMAQGPEKMDAIIQKYREMNGLSEESAKDARSLTNELQRVKAIGQNAFSSLAEPAELLAKTLHGLVDVLASAANGFMMIYHVFEPEKFKQDVARQQGVNRDFMGLFRGNGATAESASGAGSNMEESRAFWLSKGFTPAQVAGLLANEKKESSFRADAVGDNGAARGIFQWHADRRAAILSALGIDVNSATHAQQLQAAYWEMQQRGDDMRVRGASSASEAGATFSRWFERPAGGDYEAALRGQMAEQIHAQMLSDMMGAAKSSINVADQAQISARGAAPSNTVNIGAITINSQATDARGIAAEIHDEIKGQYRNVIGNWDDGVRY